MHSKRIFGNRGEDVVASWLQEKGFSIVARNYQTRLGEVDIIATQGEVLAFVEVKTRHTKYFPIAQTVTYSKQRCVIKAAHKFILENRIRDRVFRFDVATVVYNDVNYSIEYIENAFTEP